eukprot:4799940-Pleurochrysis_carterae.AAC.6
MNYCVRGQDCGFRLISLLECAPRLAGDNASRAVAVKRSHSRTRLPGGHAHARALTEELAVVRKCAQHTRCANELIWAAARRKRACVSTPLARLFRGWPRAPTPRGHALGSELARGGDQTLGLGRTRPAAPPALRG